MEAICFVSCLMIGFPPRYLCYMLAKTLSEKYIKSHIQLQNVNPYITYLALSIEIFFYLI